MLKNTLLLVSIITVSLAIVFSAYVIKDREICCDLEICRNLTDICEETEQETTDTVITSSKGDEITVVNVQKGDSILNGFTISGEASGTWYFEGEFPVRVLDSEGELLASIPAVAQGEWMTENMVPFELVVDLPIVEDTDVTLAFQKSNPSGLIENDDIVTLSLTILSSDEQTTVQVYFPNTDMGSTENCSLVFPVTRVIPKVTAIGRASLKELFEGPTQEEIEDGYSSNINEGVEIQSLSISNGIARVDLNSELEEGIGGSCLTASIRAQIEETLKQFPTVDEVVLTIDGESEGILQP